MGTIMAATKEINGGGGSGGGGGEVQRCTSYKLTPTQEAKRRCVFQAYAMHYPYARIGVQRSTLSKQPQSLCGCQLGVDLCTPMRAYG